MKVFSVFGITNSGKTTTVENIIKELKKRGYSVGTVKEIHYENFTMDSEGTDTKRHKEAGAEIVAARGFNETDILLKGKLSINQILSFYSHDYVVLEGVRDAEVPKILCAAKESEIQELLNNTVIAISGVISSACIQYKTLPVVNAITDADILVDIIEEQVTEYIFKKQYCEESKVERN